MVGHAWVLGKCSDILRKGLWTFVDFGICRNPGTDSPQIASDHHGVFYLPGRDVCLYYQVRSNLTFPTWMSSILYGVDYLPANNGQVTWLLDIKHCQADIPHPGCTEHCNVKEGSEQRYPWCSADCSERSKNIFLQGLKLESVKMVCNPCVGDLSLGKFSEES